MFYREGLLAPRPTTKLEDHPLSAVHDYLFNLFSATLHKGGRSSIRNLRTRHAVVTGTHYTWIGRSTLTVSDVNSTWRTHRMVTGTKFCWWIETSAWRSRIEEDGGCISLGNQELMEENFKLRKIQWELPDKFKEYYELSIKTFDSILDSVKDDLRGYFNFRNCNEAGEKLTVALRYVTVIVVKITINYICKMLNAIIIRCNLKGYYTRKSSS